MRIRTKLLLIFTAVILLVNAGSYLYVSKSQTLILEQDREQVLRGLFIGVTNNLLAAVSEENYPAAMRTMDIFKKQSDEVVLIHVVVLDTEIDTWSVFMTNAAAELPRDVAHLDIMSRADSEGVASSRTPGGHVFFHAEPVESAMFPDETPVTYGVRMEVTSSLIERLKEGLLWTALATAICGAMVVWVATSRISAWLSRRIQSIVHTLQSFISGDYASRNSDSSMDELGEIAAVTNFLGAKMASLRGLKEDQAILSQRRKILATAATIQLKMSSVELMRGLRADIFLSYYDFVGGDFHWAGATADGDMVVIGDVQGKGPPGCTVAIMTLTYLRTVAPTTTGRDIVDMMVRRLEGADLFVATTFVWRDATGVHHANFGNPVTYVIRNGAVHEIEPKMEPLSKHKGVVVVDDIKGERVVVFSDGYYDLVGGFSSERIKVCSDVPTGSPRSDGTIPNFHKALLAAKSPQEIIDWAGDESHVKGSITDDLSVAIIEVVPDEKLLV